MVKACRQQQCPDCKEGKDRKQLPFGFDEFEDEVATSAQNLAEHQTGHKRGDEPVAMDLMGQHVGKTGQRQHCQPSETVR